MVQLCLVTMCGPHFDYLWLLSLCQNEMKLGERSTGLYGLSECSGLVSVSSLEKKVIVHLEMKYVTENAETCFYQN